MASYRCIHFMYVVHMANYHASLSSAFWACLLCGTQLLQVSSTMTSCKLQSADMPVVPGHAFCKGHSVWGVALLCII